VVECLRGLGAKLINPGSSDVEKITTPEFDALYYEFKYGINVASSTRRPRWRRPDGPASPRLARRTDRVQQVQRGPGAVAVRRISGAAEATSGDDRPTTEAGSAAARLAVSALNADEEHNGRDHLAHRQAARSPTTSSATTIFAPPGAADRGDQLAVRFCGFSRR
jgi:hypothetical protein